MTLFAVYFLNLSYTIITYYAPKSDKPRAKNNRQRAENKKQWVKSNEQPSIFNELRSKSNEERAGSNKQRAKSNEQRAKRNEQRAKSSALGTVGSIFKLIFQNNHFCSGTEPENWRKLKWITYTLSVRIFEPLKIF